MGLRLNTYIVITFIPFHTNNDDILTAFINFQIFNSKENHIGHKQLPCNPIQHPVQRKNLPIVHLLVLTMMKRGDRFSLLSQVR